MSRLSVGRGRVDFIRQAGRAGLPLGLHYAGNWTRNPATGAVARATVSPASANFNGFMSLGLVPSPFFDERIRKWGSSFQSNGIALLPINAPVDNLTNIVSLRSGETYEVIVVSPDDLGEGRFKAVLLRDKPIYNKTLTVKVDSATTDATSVLISNLPARLTFPPSSMQAGLSQSQPGIMPAAKPALECPFIYEGSGMAGDGIVAAQAQGTLITFEPRYTFVEDAGLAYTITTMDLDPGGDQHHQRYVLGLLNR